GDGHKDPMSGEPALTAVQLLAARGATLPLLLYALLGGAAQEVLAETLRALAGLPAPLLLGVARGLRRSEDDVAVVGLFDSLVAHDDPGAFSDFVRDWALQTDRLDVLRFA